MDTLDIILIVVFAVFYVGVQLFFHIVNKGIKKRVEEIRKEGRKYHEESIKNMDEAIKARKDISKLVEENRLKEKIQTTKFFMELDDLQAEDKVEGLPFPEAWYVTDDERVNIRLTLN